MLLICLTVLSANLVFGQQKAESASCGNQLIYPNADLDNFESPIVGNVKQIETREIDLTDNTESDLIQTTNYNSQGKVTDTFLTTKKIKNFGKTLYSYDAKNRLNRRVSYNPDGSAVMEDVLNYDLNGNLKQVITQNAKSKIVIWKKDFSYEPKKNYTELFDKLHDYGFGFVKDEKCRISELTSYKLDRTVTSKMLISYDDEKNVVEQTIYSPSGKIINKKMSEYEFDKQGNWTKQTRFEPAMEEGKLIYKPVTIISRKITYFDTK